MEDFILKDEGEGEERKKVLYLPAQLNISRVQPLLEAMSKGIESTDHLYLNFSTTTDITFPALQVIYSAWKTADAQGKKLKTLGDVPKVLSTLQKESGFIHSPWYLFNPNTSPTSRPAQNLTHGELK